MHNKIINDCSKVPIKSRAVVVMDRLWEGSGLMGRG